MLKYDDDGSENGSDFEMMTDMLGNAGLDFDVQDEDDGTVLVLENGITIQFDSDMNLLSINSPEKVN